MAGIYRRGKTYWARAQRNGREFRDSLKTADRRVAKIRFEQWKERLEGLAWGDRPRVTFAEAVRQFMTEHFPTLKPKSAARYGLSLKWLSDKYEGKYLDEINRQTLSEFETDRRTGGVKSPTIRRDLACLSSMLAFCEDRDWIGEGKNPVPGFLRRRARRGLKEGDPRTRWLSHAEEAAILSKASSPLAEAIMLAVDTGLREQELFSLTWPQIDLRTQTLTTTKDTKNGRARVVPFTARSAHFLARWKGGQVAGGWPSPSVGPLSVTVLSTDCRSPPVKTTIADERISATVVSLFVFHHEDGSRFKNLYRGFKATAQRAGMIDINWHDLRRTAGCRWLQDYDKSMGEVSVMLGHSSIQVTEKSYGFFDRQRLAEETAAQKPHGART